MTGEEAVIGLFGDTTLPYLTDVSITNEHGVDTSMSLTLSPSYEEAIELLSASNPWIKFGNSIAIRWGYSDVIGGMSDWHIGFMKPPVPSFGEEISFTIEATGFNFNPGRVERQRVWSSEENPRSFKEVATEILKRYNILPYFMMKSDSAKKEIERKRGDLVQGGMTDLQFLSFFCSKMETEMVMKGLYAVFLDMNQPSDDKVSFLFQMRGKPDYQNNVYPLLSFEPQSMGTMMIPSIYGVTAWTQHPDADPEDDIEPVHVDATTSENNYFSGDVVEEVQVNSDDGPSVSVTVKLRTPDGQTESPSVKSVTPPSTEGLESGRIGFVPMTKSTTDSQVSSYLEGIRRDDAQDQGVSVTFETLAIPTLQPGMLVRLEGVGDYFNAIYKVQTIELNINDSGARMTVTANGAGVPSLDQAVTAIGVSAKKSEKPPEDIEDSETVEPSPSEGV